jgi:hypothetical protein
MKNRKCFSRIYFFDGIDLIIDRIKSSTPEAMEAFCTENEEIKEVSKFAALSVVRATRSGIFEGFDTK